VNISNSLRNKSAFKGPTPFKNSIGDANMLDDFSINYFLNITMPKNLF
jgi:hypothetical protein